jgi:hypothetical protein
MNAVRPAEQPVEEGERVAAAAVDAGLRLKVTGGVAVALRCPSARAAPLARPYADVDMVGRSGDGARIAELLTGLGYEPDEAFNALHGATRLFFWDHHNERQLDVFLDRVEMCHRIDLRARLDGDELTIPLADVLLMKLQIVETNHKDYLDVIALLTDHDFTSDDHGLNLPYLADLTGADWGLWRTLTMVAERTAETARSLPGFDRADRVEEQVATFVRALDDHPKTRGWRLRARVGERKRWYELPEESH